MNEYANRKTRTSYKAVLTTKKFPQMFNKLGHLSTQMKYNFVINTEKITKCISINLDQEHEKDLFMKTSE